jgi:hypothetical protein
MSILETFGIMSISQFGTSTVAARFRDVVSVESRRFLLRILDDPSNLEGHIKT